MEAGADDDIEHPRTIGCNRFECGANCIESELTGHDFSNRLLRNDC
jgi:hypothetical protein